MTVELSCLKCGSQVDLTSLTYKKKYTNTKIQRDGEITHYYNDRGYTTFEIPICKICLQKIKKWRLIFFSLIGFIITFGIISTIVSSLVGTVVFLIQVNLSLLYLLIFIIAHGSNPRLFNKFTFSAVKNDTLITRNYIHYVRPITSNKWVKFEIWEDVMFNSDNTKKFQLERINPLTWKLPLIGVIIIFFSILTPTYINSSGLSVNIYWLLFYYSSDSLIYFDNTNFFLSLLYVIILFVGLEVTIKQIYVLKRANTTITGSERIILLVGLIIIILTILQIVISAKLIGPAIYGLLTGSVFLIIGPLYQYYINKQINR
ncbi:MAG: hypothetical protein R3255_02635 [Candidatus Lokiarchaeia archaeon]|nr:hypothetical protein [Candidatus Lokiarchaeia archaeon]